MNTLLLTEDEFNATFIGNMKNVTKDAEAVVDIWPYVEAIPSNQLLGRRVDDVEYVYRNGSGQHEHVLVATDEKNVYLVVVIELGPCRIFGHYMLDLNEKYGLSRQPPRK